MYGKKDMSRGKALKNSSYNDCVYTTLSLVWTSNSPVMQQFARVLKVDEVPCITQAGSNAHRRLVSDLLPMCYEPIGFL